MATQQEPLSAVETEWAAHCHSVDNSQWTSQVPPALSLKPPAWVPTGGYSLSETRARPPACPPPAPLIDVALSPNVGDGGALADDGYGEDGEEGYGEEGEEAIEEVEEVYEEWGDDVAMAPMQLQSSIFRYDPTRPFMTWTLPPQALPPLTQTLPPPQEGVVTMSTEAWQRLNALAKPLAKPMSDASDSAGPQDRRLRMSMFQQAYHSDDYFSGSEEEADGKVAGPKKKDLKVHRRKGNRIIKRLRHDVKMLYNKVAKLEDANDAVWKKGYSKGCKDFFLNGSSKASCSSCKGEGKSSEPVMKGSVATGKPRQFSR